MLNQLQGGKILKQGKRGGGDKPHINKSFPEYHMQIQRWNDTILIQEGTSLLLGMELRKGGECLFLLFNLGPTALTGPEGKKKKNDLLVLWETFCLRKKGKPTGGKKSFQCRVPLFAKRAGGKGRLFKGKRSDPVTENVNEQKEGGNRFWVGRDPHAGGGFPARGEKEEKVSLGKESSRTRKDAHRKKEIRRPCSNHIGHHHLPIRAR